MSAGFFISIAIYCFTKMAIIMLTSIEHEQTLEQWIEKKNARYVKNTPFAKSVRPAPFKEWTAEQN